MRLPAFITPNFITVMRLVFVPVGAYTLFKNGGDDTTWQYISWCVFFALGMSDVLDGKLARSRGTITEFGKFLDPVADKFMIGTAMVSLSILGRMPWWITIVILTREIGITIFRLAVIIQQIWARYRVGQTTNPAFAGFGEAVNTLINRAEGKIK